jgi:hypothetical protein
MQNEQMTGWGRKEFPAPFTKATMATGDVDTAPFSGVIFFWISQAAAVDKDRVERISLLPLQRTQHRPQKWAGEFVLGNNHNNIQVQSHRNLIIAKGFPAVNIRKQPRGPKEV